MIVEILEGIWIDPELITVVKAAGKNRCVFWVTGQSALEGFVVDHSAAVFVNAVYEAMFGGVDDEEDEDGFDEEEQVQ